MTDRLSIALAQLNPVVGDIEGNLARLRAARRAAPDADLMIATELCISGYPPEDLVLKPFFQARCREAVEALAKDTADGGPAMIVGAPWVEEGRLYNAAFLLEGGVVAAVRRKVDLPNKRVFAAAPPQGPVNFRGVRIGLMVCEDMWEAEVSETLAESGAEILVVINGSPYEVEKRDVRLQLAGARVAAHEMPLIYVNQICGQDELVFDGGSFALNADGTLVAQLPIFREQVATTQWQRDGDSWRCVGAPRETIANGVEEIYGALRLGLRDYVEKNRFPGVVIGLSGGIDSAISAAVAVDALGPDRVWSVMMGSPFTSVESYEDAAECARLLGIRHDTLPIDTIMTTFGDLLKPIFDGRAPDTTEENIQARSRGIILMAISNKFGHMVLSTGNKSEMSVGYATLYGDMCGGYSVLKDVYKTTVYALSRWRNQAMPALITRPPSAELKPDQTDQDSLPPYDELDDILECLIERDLAIEDIVARGHAAETVVRVWKMIDIAEYKRRQAPPGVKISRRAFGRDRRYPITNHFRPRAE
jgi:NAD+ synthase